MCGFSYGGATNDSLITSILSGLEQLGLSRISPHEAFGGCLSASFPDTIIYRSYESGGRIRYSRQMFYHYPQDISFSDLKKAIDPTYEFMWRNPHISQPDWSMGFWSGFGDFLSLSDRENPRIIVGER